MYIEYEKDKQVKSLMFGNINVLCEDTRYVSVRAGDENIQKNDKGIFELSVNSIQVTEHTKSAPFDLELL